MSRASDWSGLHRGLANMLDMAEELGGTMSIRRSRSGGVFLRLLVPLPLPQGGAAGSAGTAGSTGGTGSAEPTQGQRW
jgi:hypothetical protein